MTILEISTGKFIKAKILPVESCEIKKFSKSKYSFLWSKENEDCQLFKLVVENSNEVLGLISLIDWIDESRIQIRLIASSKENVGKNKKFDKIAGCLIGFACRLAIKKYGDLACVSLLSKTELKSHYMKKYGMLDSGNQLYLEGSNLINLIFNYI